MIAANKISKVTQTTIIIVTVVDKTLSFWALSPMLETVVDWFA